MRFSYLYFGLNKIVRFWFVQSHIFLLNFDICCNFPLPNMLGNH